MSKFNRGPVKAAVSSPVVSGPEPSTRTALGAPGYAREGQSELFLLAACNLPGEKAFHENRDARVERYRHLVREMAAVDPAWTAGLLGWMRGDGNLRLAPVIGAAEFTWARRDEAGTGRDTGVTTFPRAVVNSVLQRADEPGELAAYWLAHYGRPLPIGLKRGLADGIFRLYSEFGLLKYDTAEAALRFGDVIELVNPRYHRKVYGTWRESLYRYAIERRHDRGNEVPEVLATIRRRQALMAVPVGARRAWLNRPEATGDLIAAGMTWEALAGWLQGPLTREAWTAAIPMMGLGALAKNLRNFDQAGVPDQVAELVAAKLADPDRVAKSRLFPFRFLAAYRYAPSLRWGYPLEQALNHSLANVPALPGRTLVLVDRSPSMWMQRMSGDSDISWADSAAVFGAAVALRAQHADLVEFWGQDMGRGRNAVMRFTKGESVLKVVERFAVKDREWGTDIPSAVRAHFRAGYHDRVVIVTDEQTSTGYLPSNCLFDGGMPNTKIDDLIPQPVPVYLWNFGGYKTGALPSGSRNRHTMGGLTDNAFRLIPILEASHDATWPWLLPSAERAA
jgi:TROVE domain